jgi:hypothetical protein
VVRDAIGVGCLIGTYVRTNEIRVADDESVVGLDSAIA